MRERRWRTAYASVVGTSHSKTGSPCQDAGGCIVVTTSDGREMLVAAVSDGAGTASHSDAGSKLAVAYFLRVFGEVAASDPELASVDRAFVDGWLGEVRGAITELAAAERNQDSDYACTLLGAVIGPSGAAYLQIGDGAIVVADQETGEFAWIFWPQHGEYANSTNFLTQKGAAEALFFEIGPPVDEIAMFSDGIERLVLDMSVATVHSPAFRPVFDWLGGTEPANIDRPSEVLTAYLASDHVNGRTDDDKTLVMATRAEPRAPLA